MASNINSLNISKISNEAYPIIFDFYGSYNLANIPIEQWKTGVYIAIMPSKSASYSYKTIRISSFNILGESSINGGTRLFEFGALDSGTISTMYYDSSCTIYSTSSAYKTLRFYASGGGGNSVYNCNGIVIKI